MICATIYIYEYIYAIRFNLKILNFTHKFYLQTLTLQNNPETDLDLWHPTLGYGFHIQR
jgi:hypothetical protein